MMLQNLVVSACLLLFPLVGFSDVVATDSVAVTEEVAPVKETEIPLHLESKINPSDSGSPIVRILLVIAICGLAGVGGFVAIRKKSIKMSPQGPLMQIKMLTQFHMGPKKSLAVIRVAGESLLIGVTDTQISMIKSLSLLDEDLPDPMQSQKSFASTLAAQNGPQSNVGPEDFSFSEMKDVITEKLKNLRPL